MWKMLINCQYIYLGGYLQKQQRTCSNSSVLSNLYWLYRVMPVYFEDTQICTATIPGQAQRFDQAISHFAVNKHAGLTFLACKCRQSRMAPWHLVLWRKLQSVLETYQNPTLATCCELKLVDTFLLSERSF